MTLRGPSPEQEARLWQALTVFCSGVLAAFALGILWGVLQVLVLLQAVLVPVAIAAVLACIVSPVVDWLEKQGWQRSWAVIALFIGVVLIGGSFLLWLVPRVVDQLVTLVQTAPSLLERLRTIVTSWATEHPAMIDWWNAQQRRLLAEWTQYAPHLADYTWRVVNQLAGGISFALGLIFVPIYLFFLLIEQPHIAARWREYVPLRRSALRDEIVLVLGEINRYLIAFFRGQVLVSAIVGLVTGLGLWAIGLKYALLIGVVTAVFGIIPFLGVLLCLVPTVLLALVQSGGEWWYPALALGVCMGAQTLEGTVIAPKIMGDCTGLHPLTIILAILIWSTLLGGLMGALLAVPLTATLKVLMFRYVWRQEEPAQT